MNLDDKFKRPGRPADILEDLKRADPGFWEEAVKDAAPKVVASAAVPLASLRLPAPGNTEELIGKRYLCKGGAMLLAGPTGIGKSSLSMQMAISFAAGQECFGMVPPRRLKTLLMQAENDDGDLSEMRDGVLRGMKLHPRDIGDRVMVLTDDSSTRERFAAVMDASLADGGFDLVIVDPALAYMGCDASDQGLVSAFLRNMINPVLHRRNVGMILVHHTNKPKTGEEKAEWKGSDMSYIGSGTAEFANWARAVMGIRSIGSTSVFELVASKRGRRLGWKDEEGVGCAVKAIAYHKDDDVICWREATEKEVEETGGPKITVEKVVGLIRAGSRRHKDIVKKIMDDTGVGHSRANDVVARSVATGVVRRETLAGEDRFVVAEDAMKAKEAARAERRRTKELLKPAATTSDDSPVVAAEVKEEPRTEAKVSIPF